MISAAARPRLRRSLDVRLTAGGSLYALRGPGLGDLELEGDTRGLARLLELADGSLEVGDLVRAACRTVAEQKGIEEALVSLVEAGVLDDAAQEVAQLGPESLRFERQLASFADMVGSADGAIEAQRRLARSTVCLLGLGGLGCWAAWGVVSAGVGRVVGVDCDAVELSNLNRQVLYTEADLGRAKAEAAGEALRRFRGALQYEQRPCRIDGVAAVREAVRGADFVVDSLDSPPHDVTRWVTEGCFAEGIPYLALSQHPPLIRVGPLYVPGETGCYGCQEELYRRDYPLYSALEGARQIRPPSATFGPACGIVGTIAANETVAWLAGLHRPASVGAAALVDLRALRVEWERVTAVAGCAICGGRG